MPLGIGSALWAYVAPIAETNMATNPSYEFGTAGVVAIQSAALGTSSDFQRYGAWSLKVTPNSNGTSGALLGTVTTGNGTTYSVSCWVLGAQGVNYRLGIGDNAGLNLTSGTQTFTGGGTWAWYSCGIIEAAQGTRGVVVQKTSGNSQTPIYIDGLKISPWTDSIDRQTTYLDGDTGGGTWVGAPHASISFRPSQYRSGGSIIALADIGLQVDQMIGVGMPPIEDSNQSYAIVDGAQFQRQRAAARHFTLTAKPIVGTSLADFHITRRTIIDAFKPDLVTPQQPIRFMYVGGQGTIQIDAYYEKGLELGNMDGPIAEDAAIGFAAYDPYWYAPTQQGTTLSAQVSLGSVNFMARRNPQGLWGTMGANGTTIAQIDSLPVAVRAMAFNSGGTLILAGGFGSVGGTIAPHIGMYYPQTNTFGTLVGGTLDRLGGPLLALAINPNGTLFFGGQFTVVAGTATNHIGRHFNNAFGTLVGGTLGDASGYVDALLYSPFGSLFVGGFYDTAAGSICNSLSIWTGAAYGTLIGGTAKNGASSPLIRSMALGADNRLFYAGAITTIQGTQGTAIGQWKNNAHGTLQNPVNYTAGVTYGIINAIAVGPNGVLYEAGNVDTIASGTARTALTWNGVSQSGLGAGLAYSPGVIGFGTASEGWAVLADQDTGNVYYGGAFNQVGSIPAAANYAVWNGYTWLLPDISFIGGGFNLGTVYALAQSNQGDLYIAGTFSGTAQAASVGTIVNTGRAQVYPTIRMWNSGATGTARVYQLLNTTTGAGIYFNETVLPGEVITLTLTPGNRSFQSNFAGNILNTILPGSNLATWSLLPGTNYVSFFSDNTNLITSMYWQGRSWSIDGGTVS